MQRTPEQNRGRSESGKFSSVSAYVRERVPETDRIVSACEAIESSGARHPQYASATFRRGGVELQQRLLERLGAPIGPDNAEAIAELGRAEITARKNVLARVDPSGPFARIVQTELGELAILESAFRSLTATPEPIPEPTPDTGSPSNKQLTAAGVEPDTGPSPTEARTPESAHPVESVDWVVVPPDAMERPIVAGDNIPEWMERMGGPRIATLRSVLAELSQPYREIVGTVPEGSMREHPYHGFDVPGLRRVVFVNDDYGEATYVVEGTHSLERVGRRSKRELRAFVGARRISYPGDITTWKELVVEALTVNFEGERIGRDHLSLAQIQRLLGGTAGTRRMRDDVLVSLFEKMRDLPGFEGIEWRRDSGGTSRSGNVIYEYNPEFVEKAIDLLAVFTKPNDGWMTIGAVRTMVAEQLLKIEKQSADHLTVKNMLEEYLAADGAAARGHETRRYLGMGTPSAEDQQNNPFGLRSHFSPELVRTVAERLVREAPPVGWSTTNAIRARLKGHRADKHDDVIRQKARELARSNPDTYEIGRYRDSGPKHDKEEGGLNFFVNPALADALVAHFAAQR